MIDHRICVERLLLMLDKKTEITQPNDHFQRNHNIDLNWQVQINLSIALLFLFIPASWLVVFAWLGDLIGTLICSFFIFNTLLFIIFILLNGSKLVRFFWLFNCNIGILAALVFASPGEDADLFFLIVLAVPFLVFSRQKEPFYLLFSFLIPILFWCTTYYFDLTGYSMQLLGIPLMEPKIDLNNLNTSIRATVGVSLVALLGIFTHLTSKTEQQLYLASKNAAEALKVKDNYLGNMSHEIRTYLNGLVGTIEAFATTQQSLAQSRTISTIRYSAFLLSRVIDDILDATKINAGQLDIENTEMELRPVMEGAVITLQTMADDVNVRLALSIDPDVPTCILADSGRLRQIFLNLISNAIKYTADDLIGRTGCVYVSVNKVASSILVIKIQDEGIGMSQEFQQRLFQPFVQSETILTRPVSGTGLGLVITKQLIHQMGGMLNIKSKQGIGTTITVEFPFSEISRPIEPFGIRHLEIKYLRQDGTREIWKLTENLKKHGAIVTQKLVSGGRKDFVATSESGVIYLLQSNTVKQITTWQEHIRKISSNPKFVILSESRSDSLGHLEEDTFCIQLNPVLPLELINALGVLSGRKRSSLTQQELLISQGSIPKNYKQRKAKVLLLVENNKINQYSILKQLEVLGYSADVVGNGRDGLNHWKSGKYDAVLSDCNMPIMDGFEMTKAGRRWERKNKVKPIPIIAITANALRGDADKCLAAGMDDYLAKPVEIKVLEAKLVAFVGL